MPFVDHRQTHMTEEAPGEQVSTTGSLDIPGLVTQLSPVEQIPFPEEAASASTQVAPYDPPASANVALQTVSQSPITPLPPTMAGTLSATRNTTALRDPLVIRGTGKKSNGMARPPRGRRLVVHVAVTALLVCIVLGTLLAVIPAGSEANTGFHLSNPIAKLFANKSTSVNSIAAQAATATFVTQGGYDPGNYQGVYDGVPTPPVDASSGGANHFYYGQCTWHAANRYHALTGKWVPWLGDAYQWYYGALSYHWTVSATPHVPSIMVMMPGTQGASPYYGHVAVTEQILGGGKVLTSNYNWGPGHWGVLTNEVFQQGPGIWFVYFPGM